MSETIDTARFDFEGSLKLARELWAFSTFLQTNAENLDTLAENLLQTWTGRFATEFSKKIETETSQAKLLASGLEAAANNWAAKWKQAADDRNKADRKIEVEELATTVDILYANSLIPPTPFVATPQPPTFLPTQS